MPQAKGGTYMKILTAYFSHSGENYFSGKIINIEKGNTAIVAEKIAAMTGCTLFEIKRKTPYPENYRECVKEAKREVVVSARPELEKDIDVSGYDTVILGYPNWCGTMPAPVFTFLDSAELSGKTVLPLCTNEGSGLGKSVADIKKVAPQAKVADGLSIKGGNARECDAALKKWLEDNGVL